MNQRVGTNGFIVKNGKFLLVKRSDKDAFLPCIWEIPGGKLEYGEDVEDGLLREVLEETGLKVEAISPLSTWQYGHMFGDTQYVQIDYLCKLEGEQEVKLSEEHSDFKWITFDEMDNFEISPELKEELLKIRSHPLVHLDS